jgi:tetratricopeptide (TPR) repeat protein
MDKFEQKLEYSFKEKPDQPRLLLASAVGIEREAKYIELVGGKDAPEKAKAKRDISQAKYKDFFAAKSNDPYLQYFTGEWNFRKADYAAAEINFAAVTESTPSYAPGLAAAGATALRLKKWNDAKKFYESASALDPSNAEYWAGQGLAVLGQKDLGSAKDKLSRAIALNSKNVSALCGLGYISNAAREKSNAIGYLEQALSVDGRCAYAAEALRKIYTQDGMDLQYLTFDDNMIPANWGGRGRGIIKPEVKDGHVAFVGAQGSANGEAIEFFTEARCDDFVRLEADFDAPAGNATTLGLRLSGGAGSRFFLEFAKTEADEMKVRFADSVGTTEDWKSIGGVKWPDEGHARLAIETTDELKNGKVILSVNGRKYTEIQLRLNRTNKITAGVFVQVPQNTAVNVAADNIALLTRRPLTPTEKDGGDAIKILTPAGEEKKPAPAPAPAPAPNGNGGEQAPPPPKDKDAK